VTGEDIGAFLEAFETWLNGAIGETEPSEIVFEAPILDARRTSLPTARKLYSLCGLTELIARKRKIPVSEANLAQIRSHFIGTSKAPKDIKNPADRRKWLKAKTIARCHERGFKVTTDDEGDAVAQLDYALSVRDANHSLVTTPLFANQEITP